MGIVMEVYASRLVLPETSQGPGRSKPQALNPTSIDFAPSPQPSRGLARVTIFLFMLCWTVMACNAPNSSLAAIVTIELAHGAE